MRKLTLLPVAALVVLSVSSCDRSSEEASVLEARVEALERQNADALKRQRALTYELEEQRLANESEAIEHERMLLDEARNVLGGSHREGVSELVDRERDLAGRELSLEGRQEDHFERRAQIYGGKLQPNEADLALAGRLAGNFTSEVETEVTEDQFYQALAPYGSWFESAQYGYVWQPAACQNPSWRPYTRGQWACSDRGWTWISTEPFGWATYHYGRWANLGGSRGWIWVPGTEWGPSWCSWRASDQFIGWAPLPPETLNHDGRNLDSTIETRFPIDPRCFTFVKNAHFDRLISRYCVPLSENVTCVQTSQNVTCVQFVDGRVFCGGPGYLELTAKVGRRIPYGMVKARRDESGRKFSGELRTRIKGDRIVVTAPVANQAVAALTRPTRVRGNVESIGARPTARVSQPGSGVDDGLDARMVEVLMPDLSEKAWAAGFPTEEIASEKIVLPELQTVPLKPKIEEAEAATDDSASGDDRTAGRGERTRSENSERTQENDRTQSEPAAQRASETPARPSRVEPERPSARSSTKEEDHDDRRDGPRSR